MPIVSSPMLPFVALTVLFTFLSLSLSSFPFSSSSSSSRSFSPVEAPDGCTSIGFTPSSTSPSTGTLITHSADCKNCDFRLSFVKEKDFDVGEKRPIYPFRLEYPRYVGNERGHTYEQKQIIRDNPIASASHSIHEWTPTAPIGYISQVDHTYQYIDGVYGISNEFELSLGESTAPSKLVNVRRMSVDDISHALFDIAELSRIALERCLTVQCAIHTMGDLAVQYGYYGADGGLSHHEWQRRAVGGEVLLLGDTKEVWVFHISADGSNTSAVWAAKRVPKNHYVVVANSFIIQNIVGKGEEFTSDNILYSPNIFDVAIREGLWEESMGRENFNFAHVFGNPIKNEIPYCSRRRWRVMSLLTPEEQISPFSTVLALPFSLAPSSPPNITQVFSLLRDHYEGTPFSLTKGIASGPFGNPNRYDRGSQRFLTEEIQRDRKAMEREWRGDFYGVGEDGKSDDIVIGELRKQSSTDESDLPILFQGTFERAISLYRTTYSYVTQAKDNEKFPHSTSARVFFAPSPPTSTPFFPLYHHVNSLPSIVTTGSLYELNRNSLWWAGTSIGNWMEKNWEQIAPKMLHHIHSFESHSLSTKCEQMELSTLSLFVAEKDKDAKTFLTNEINQWGQEVIIKWWNILDSLITEFHDGYKMDVEVQRMGDTINPTPLFFPLEWLERDDVGFFKNIGGKDRINENKTHFEYSQNWNYIQKDPSVQEKGTEKERGKANSDDKVKNRRGKSSSSLSSMDSNSLSETNGISPLSLTKSSSVSSTFLFRAFCVSGIFAIGLFVGKKTRHHHHQNEKEYQRVDG